MSYKDLDIWKLAGGVIKEIHEMISLKLSKFEMYEIRSQIRRSSKIEDHFPGI